MHMIQESQFSACPATARGGLLICGMNWGGSANEAERGIETESAPCAPYFSHPENYSFGFQAPLITWFGLWGFGLSHETPTQLDRAMAQTNIFFDQSPRFVNTPEKDKWIFGLTRLAETIEQMDCSGILLVSTRVVDWIIRLSANGEIPKWNQVVGKQEWDTPRYHRLNLRFGRNGLRLIAGVSHPSSGVAHGDVEAAATEMRSWINEVLGMHETKNYFP